MYVKENVSDSSDVDIFLYFPVRHAGGRYLSMSSSRSRIFDDVWRGEDGREQQQWTSRSQLPGCLVTESRTRVQLSAGPWRNIKAIINPLIHVWAACADGSMSTRHFNEGPWRLFIFHILGCRFIYLYLTIQTVVDEPDWSECPTWKLINLYLLSSMRI